jgi:hypothetical protein
MKLTTSELVIFERLVIENRDSAKLQKITECSYLESINLLNKIRKILGR